MACSDANPSPIRPRRTLVGALCCWLVADGKRRCAYCRLRLRHLGVRRAMRTVEQFWSPQRIAKFELHTSRALTGSVGNHSGTYGAC